jgi:hypothetical protein
MVKSELYPIQETGELISHIENKSIQAVRTSMAIIHRTEMPDMVDNLGKCKVIRSLYVSESTMVDDV